MPSKLRPFLTAFVFIVFAASVLGACWFLPTPSVIRTSVSGKEVKALSQPLVFQFDRPVSRLKLEKMITPDIPGTWVFETPLFSRHLVRQVVFRPQYSFQPNTDYTITLSGIVNASGWSRSISQTFSFHTEGIPDVSSFSVSEGQLNRSPTDPIIAKLSAATNGNTEFNFRLFPSTPLTATLSEDKRSYQISFPKPLEPGMAYLLTAERIVVVEDLESKIVVSREPAKIVARLHFATSGQPDAATAFSREHPIYSPVKVLTSDPKDTNTGVALKPRVAITFDQAVNHASAQSQFAIVPATLGVFDWEANTMIWTPSQPLTAGSQYVVTISPGVRSVVGPPSTETFVLHFTTSAIVAKLAVPSFLQQHALSSELSSLRMALAYRGKDIAEDTLLNLVGVDPSAHRGSIWGDPNEQYVGNVNGKQMWDGYGVHWNPIARVARGYRKAESFENWTLDKLTAQIDGGNPVLVWVFATKGLPTSWYTPSGKQIQAVSDEHCVVVVGYTGNPKDPTQFVVNDPLVGQVFWTKNWFEKKWGIFNRSGVVVY